MRQVIGRVLLMGFGIWLIPDSGHSQEPTEPSRQEEASSQEEKNAGPLILPPTSSAWSPDSLPQQTMPSSSIPRELRRENRPSNP